MTDQENTITITVDESYKNIFGCATDPNYRSIVDGHVLGYHDFLNCINRPPDGPFDVVQRIISGMMDPAVVTVTDFQNILSQYHLTKDTAERFQAMFETHVLPNKNRPISDKYTFLKGV